MVNVILEESDSPIARSVAAKLAADRRGAYAAIHVGRNYPDCLKAGTTRIDPAELTNG